MPIRTKSLIVLAFLMCGCATTDPVEPHIEAAKQFLETENFELAISEANRAIGINPESANALSIRGYAKSFAGYPLEDAFKDLDFALKIGGSYGRYMRRATVRHNAGLFLREALADCDQAIRYAKARGVNPDDLDALGRGFSINVGPKENAQYDAMVRTAQNLRDLILKQMQE